VAERMASCNLVGLRSASVSDVHESYGYQIAITLKDRGLGTVGGGTLYPVLKRLEANGLPQSNWREGAGGPGRKFYQVTPEGRAVLAETASAWRKFSQVSTQLFTSGGAGR